MWIIKELDVVVLTAPIAEERFEPGDVGTVVRVHAGGAAYEVEFFTLDGDTAAVATVEATQLKPVEPTEITHARDMAKR